MMKTLTTMVNRTLNEIRRADPTADLALSLFKGGCTEEQLHEMLAGRRDPLGTELENKFRDITRGGSTTNRYGVTRRLR